MFESIWNNKYMYIAGGSENKYPPKKNYLALSAVGEHILLFAQCSLVYILGISIPSFLRYVLIGINALLLSIAIHIELFKLYTHKY